MAGNWDFGGAFLDSTGQAQRQDIELAKAPVEIQHMQALASLQTAQAAEANQRVAAEKAMAGILANTQLTTGNASDQMLQLATIASKAGAGTLAKDYLLRATQMKTQEARTEAFNATDARERAALRLKQAELFNNLHSGATDQGSWDTANMAFTSQTGEPVPPEMRNYSPELAQNLLNSSLKLKDRLRLDMEREDVDSKAANRQNQAQYRALNYQLRASAEQRRADAAAAKAKDGGKDVGAPSKQEVNMASDLIAGDPTLKFGESADATNAANDIASRARALRKGNPGLDQGEAMQRALVELKTSGAFVTTPSRMPWGQPSTKYSRAGMASSAPIELSTKPDPSKLIPGRYYKGPGGVFRWDGKRAVATTVQPTASTSAPDDEDEE